MTIDERGFWIGEKDSQHQFDQKICEKILNFCQEKKVKSAVDFGCGRGDYVSALNKNKINCIGYDGNPETEKIENCKVLDLSSEFDLKTKFELTISLEVGEHIPEKFENIFLSNLVNHTKKYIILSWAIPNQVGHGHVNCKSNDYIIKKVCQDNFEYLEKESKNFRDSASLWWFKKTIMIFSRHI